MCFVLIIVDDYKVDDGCRRIKNIFLIKADFWKLSYILWFFWYDSKADYILGLRQERLTNFESLSNFLLDFVFII